jgi:hypothetical protein
VARRRGRAGSAAGAFRRPLLGQARRRGLEHPQGPDRAWRNGGAGSTARVPRGARRVPAGELVPLPPLRQKGGKWVEGFALEGDFDPAALLSNSFSLEWPPRSGRVQSFPEVDRVRWFPLLQAEEMILPSQRPLLAALPEVIPS